MTKFPKLIIKILSQKLYEKKKGGDSHVVLAEFWATKSNNNNRTQARFQSGTYTNDAHCPRPCPAPLGVAPFTAKLWKLYLSLSPMFWGSHPICKRKKGKAKKSFVILCLFVVWYGKCPTICVLFSFPFYVVVVCFFSSKMQEFILPCNKKRAKIWTIPHTPTCPPGDAQ